jgi:hypothetical protein
MKKQLYIFVILILSFSNTLKAQNGADYFPSATGHKWFYTTTPRDSLNQPVNSLTFVTDDSFAVSGNFRGKPTNFVLGKAGTKQTVLRSPYMDTSYVSTDQTNILIYTGAIPGIDTVSIGFLNNVNDWYSVYRLAQTLNSSYTIFTRDTVVNYSGVNTTFTTEIKGKRIADQLITTALGDFLCKKFIITYDIKATVFIFPITLLAINDTVYLAPGNYIVRDVRASSNVDLSSFGQLAFYIPGSTMDILAPPAVLSADQDNISVKYNSGDSLVSVFNSGSGSLNWKANVTSGNSWLQLNDSSGNGNGVIRFSFTQNNDNILRAGTITVSDPDAWDSPQVIIVTQGAKITSITDKNKIPLEFNLSQNYPNPFNPSTAIKFSLPQAAHVTLSVFNSMGQEVTKLISKDMGAGVYTTEWNASGFASGVYYCRIVAGKFIQTKKLILLK